MPTQLSDETLERLSGQILDVIRKEGPMSTTSIAYAIDALQQTASFTLRWMVGKGLLDRKRHGPRMVYGLPGDKKKIEEIPKKETLYRTLCDFVTKTGKAATVSELAVRTGYTSSSVYGLLAELRMVGKVEKIPMSGETKGNQKFAYIPGDERMRIEGKAVPINVTPGNARFPFITKNEIRATKRKVKIGDVFRARYTMEEDEEDRYVVIDLKSRHLIRCVDGETYSYADLAIYYRHKGRLPLGVWT